MVESLSLILGVVVSNLHVNNGFFYYMRKT